MLMPENSKNNCMKRTISRTVLLLLLLPASVPRADLIGSGPEISPPQDLDQSLDLSPEQASGIRHQSQIQLSETGPVS